VEKLDTLPIDVPILRRTKVMMKELSKIRIKSTLIIKISSTRKIKRSLPKKKVVHQKQMKKTN
jgi:hypothetical protein